MNFDKRFSQIFGIVGGLKFPRAVQNFINERYVKFFNIDMSEFAPASSYESLNALFTRELLKPRDFDAQERAFLSPSDGTCLSSGTSERGAAFSVKGMSYDLRELLSEAASEEETLREWDFANIYLSPRDYHRYHAPCDLKIERAVYIPGRLYSVAKSWLARVAGLYAKNERMVLRCEMNGGERLWLVFVGALNVGRMKFCFDERIQTNANADFTQVYGYENLRVLKGQQLGNFELGSTILIISQKGAIEYNLFPEKPLKQGETIGLLNERAL